MNAASDTSDLKYQIKQETSERWKASADTLPFLIGYGSTPEKALKQLGKEAKDWYRLMPVAAQPGTPQFVIKEALYTIIWSFTYDPAPKVAVIASEEE